MSLTLPTVHLNGTSRDGLLEGYIAAMDAIRLAMKALQSAAPHPRDYYVQSNMSAHLARDEHFTRLARFSCRCAADRWSGLRAGR